MFRFGFTVNDAVFSVWKGQRPFQFSPARLSFTTWPTISTMSTRDRISSRCCWVKPPGMEVLSLALGERGHRRAGTALGGRARTVLGDQGMAVEEVLDRATQGAGALAVDDADGGEAGQERVVEVLLEEIPRLVGGAPDEMQLARHPALAGHRHRPPITLSIPGLRARSRPHPGARIQDSLAARHIAARGVAPGDHRARLHRRGLAVDGQHLAPEPEVRDLDAVARRSGAPRVRPGRGGGTRGPLHVLRGLDQALAR